MSSSVGVLGILDSWSAIFSLSWLTKCWDFFFWNLKLEEGEPVDAFVTRLREKAATCEYGAIRDELIRNRLMRVLDDVC